MFNGSKIESLKRHIDYLEEYKISRCITGNKETADKLEMLMKFLNLRVSYSDPKVEIVRVKR